MTAPAAQIAALARTIRQLFKNLRFQMIDDKQFRAQPDTTLQQLREQLEEAKQVGLSMGRMWLALRQLGLPLKKKRSTHKSKIVKPRSAAAKPGEKP